MNTKMTTAQYLTLVEQMDAPKASKAALAARIEAGDAGARFTVYGMALRKGFVRRTAAAVEMVTCSCGATYNANSRSMAYVHSGCGK